VQATKIAARKIELFDDNNSKNSFIINEPQK